MIERTSSSDVSDDTVLKKCVSSKVLIFVVNKKNQRKNNEAYNRTKIGINF